MQKTIVVSDIDGTIVPYPFFDSKLFTDPDKFTPVLKELKPLPWLGTRSWFSERNEVYFVTDDPNRIPFDDLPDKFVIKANHGCGWNIVVTDTTELDRQAVVRQCRKWLNAKYGASSRHYELHYDAIEPAIIVERFLGDGSGNAPLDYKFFCFHGKAQCVDVIDRYTGPSPTQTFYSMAWQVLGFNMVYPKGDPVPKPASLDRMVEVAEILASPFEFARIDLYSPSDEAIVLGEITLVPGGGIGRFYPTREWDFRLGELW